MLPVDQASGVKQGSTRPSPKVPTVSTGKRLSRTLVVLQVEINPVAVGVAMGTPILTLSLPIRLPVEDSTRLRERVVPAETRTMAGKRICGLIDWGAAIVPVVRWAKRASVIPAMVILAVARWSVLGPLIGSLNCLNLQRNFLR